jgi:hypothetical protein
MDEFSGIYISDLLKPDLKNWDKFNTERLHILFLRKHRLITTIAEVLEKASKYEKNH